MNQATQAFRTEINRRTQEIGKELLARVEGEKEAFFRAERWTGQLLEWSMRHDETKLQLFRFVDVLPTLKDPEDVVRHLREYFEDRPDPFGGALKLGLGFLASGKLGARATRLALRKGVEQVARSFIAGSTADEVLQKARDFHKQA